MKGHALKRRVVVASGREVAEVLRVPWWQLWMREASDIGTSSSLREGSWVLLMIGVQDGVLLGRHPMLHPLHIQGEVVGGLMWRIRIPWAGNFLGFRTFLLPAAPWSADDRSGKGSALLRSFQSLLWGGR